MYQRTGMGIIRICDVSRVERNTLNPERQAIWDVQNRLCAERHDPGPVDGNIGSRWLPSALSAFQQRMRLPETGRIDAVTLRAMGFSTADATRIAAAAATTPLGPTPEGPPLPQFQVPWVPILLSLGAGTFMIFAVRSYMKR
jgi:hypothetical protein